MKGNYLNKLLRIDALHALYREDGKWYHSLKSFPGILFDKNGYVVFQNKDAYLMHEKLQHKKDLHIIGGISNLPEYKLFTEFEKQLIGGININISNKNVDEKITVIREIEIILRNKRHVNYLKALYENTCQICGIQVQIGQDKYYSEVHHIIQLGRPHNGSDSLENMICVCPNHHVQMDLKSFYFDLQKMKVLKHKISTESVDHHNQIYSLNSKL